MPGKIILASVFWLAAGPLLALNLTGAFDFSAQYSTNFLEAGLYEEAQTLLTGEADYLTQAKFNLGVEHNFTPGNYSKLEYILETQNYNKNTSLNLMDHTFAFQMEHRLSQGSAVKIKASGEKHNEENALKKYIQGVFLLKGIKEIKPNLDLELSLAYDKRNMDNTAPRDYFAYMSQNQIGLGAKFRYGLRKDLVCRLKIENNRKQYDHTASSYLSGVFSVLSGKYREDEKNSIGLDFTRVIHENLLVNVALGYINNPSNVSYYQYSGFVLGSSVFGYWLGNRWQASCDYGGYGYPNRFGVGFNQENLQSAKFKISCRREIKDNIYVSLEWEGIRNSSNNPLNNFNNDSYGGGVSIQF